MKITLILLPGLNGTTGLFAPLLKCVDGNFEILPISFPTQEKLSYQELTTFVLEKIESVQGDYIVLGESFSGPLALFVSEKKPDGLLGVVLVSTFISAPNFRIGRYLPWTLGFLLVRPLYRIRMIFSKSENRYIVAMMSVELKKASPDVLAFRIQEVFSVDATESLRNCNVPVVYFRGLRDIVVPKKNLRKILSVKPDVNVVEFKAPHFLLQTEPQQVFSEIKRFAEKCR